MACHNVLTVVTTTQKGWSDAYGLGGFRLVSIGCPQDAAVSCAQQFVLVVSSIPTSTQSVSAIPGRSLLMFYMEQRDGATPQVKFVLDVGLFSGDQHEAVMKGGTARTFSPQGMGLFGVYHLWTLTP